MQVLGLPLWGLLDNPYSDSECFDNGAPMDYDGIQYVAGDEHYWQQWDKVCSEKREIMKRRLLQLRPQVTYRMCDCLP